MSSNHHVLMLDKLTQHLEHDVLSHFFALVFALDAQTQVHQESSGVLEAVV